MCEPTNEFSTPAHDCAEAHHVLALAAHHEGEVFASGSAVLVAPHLALTARHVTEDFTQHFEGQAVCADGRATFAILARGYFGGAWRMFDVLRTFNTAGTDVTALYLTPACGEPADFVWPRVELDLLPPRTGRRVSTWGHINPHASFSGPSQEAIHWYATLARSSGTVGEIFPRERDSALVNYPAFHFDARVDGSMSGGPVFDEHGRLVGINTRSLPATATDPVHTSTAALMWPVPALPFATDGETYPPNADVQFIEDLHRLGFLSMLNHEAVRVDRATSPSELHVSVTITGDRH